MLQGMPAILRETLLFPYTTGLTFVQAFQAEGGWSAVNELYDRMPTSTEQILHPVAYVANEAPVAVALPADLVTELGDGWSVPLEDTFGELQLGIWLRESGIPAEVAATATAGWGGDRLAVYQGPDDAWAVIVETRWDSARDATEFADAAQSAVDGLANEAVLSTADDDAVTIVIASDDKTLLDLDVLVGATGV